MEEINIKELLDYYVSNFYYFILVIVLFTLGGYIYFNDIQKPLYHSSATVILVSETDDTKYSDVTLNHQLVSTYSQIIKNSDILKTVIKNLDLDITETELANDITVTAIEDTEIIKIEVSYFNKKLAQEIATEVTKTFTIRVNEIYKLQNIVILSKAQVENKPYNKDIVKQTFITSIVGLFVAIVIVTVKFYFDTTIKSENDIENKIGLAVLGKVVKVGNKNEK